MNILLHGFSFPLFFSSFQNKQIKNNVFLLPFLLLKQLRTMLFLCVVPILRGIGLLPSYWTLNRRFCAIASIPFRWLKYFVGRGPMGLPRFNVLDSQHNSVVGLNGEQFVVGPYFFAWAHPWEINSVGHLSFCCLLQQSAHVLPC